MILLGKSSQFKVLPSLIYILAIAFSSLFAPVTGTRLSTELRESGERGRVPEAKDMQELAGGIASLSIIVDKADSDKNFKDTKAVGEVCSGLSEGILEPEARAASGSKAQVDLELALGEQTSEEPLKGSWRVAETFAYLEGVRNAANLKAFDKFLEEARSDLQKEKPNLSHGELNKQLDILLVEWKLWREDPRVWIDEAIQNKCGSFLKTIYPARSAWWTRRDDLAYYFAKIFGTEWMAGKDWKKYTQAHGIDWRLYVRVLVSSNNPKVFESQQMRDVITSSRLFKEGLHDLAYDALRRGYFEFLRIIKPDDFSHDSSKNWFNRASYGEEWRNEELWKDYSAPTYGLLAMIRSGNSNFLNHPAYKRYTTIESTMEYCTREQAEHLLQTLKREQFLKALEPHKARLFGAEAPLWTDGKYKENLGLLNVYLRAGGKIDDPNKIPFGKIRLFDKDCLKSLLENGYNQLPDSSCDLWCLGETPTGRELLRTILKEEYPTEGKKYKIPDEALVVVGDIGEDTELFDMIYAKLPEEKQRRYIERVYGNACLHGYTNLLRHLLDKKFTPQSLWFMIGYGYYELAAEAAELNRELLEEVWGDSSEEAALFKACWGGRERRLKENYEVSRRKG